MDQLARMAAQPQQPLAAVSIEQALGLLIGIALVLGLALLVEAAYADRIAARQTARYATRKLAPTPGSPSRLQVRCSIDQLIVYGDLLTRHDRL